MQIQITKNYDEMSQLAADWVIDAIRANPQSTIVFPTGKTPEGLYRELIARYEMPE